MFSLTVRFLCCLLTQQYNISQTPARCTIVWYIAPYSGGGQDFYISTLCILTRRRKDFYRITAVTDSYSNYNLNTKSYTSFPQWINFLKRCFQKLAYIYYNKCFLRIKSGLRLKEKNLTQHWFSYFQTACKHLKSFMTDPLNIIFDDFSTWLLFCKDQVQLSIYSTRALFHKYF